MRKQLSTRKYEFHSLHVSIGTQKYCCCSPLEWTVMDPRTALAPAKRSVGQYIPDTSASAALYETRRKAHSTSFHTWQAHVVRLWSLPRGGLGHCCFHVFRQHRGSAFHQCCIWSTIFGFEAFQSSVCLQSQYLNTRYRALDNFANTSPSCSGHPRTGHDNLPTVHAAKGLLLEVRLRRTVHLAPPPPCHSAFVYHQLSAKKAYSRILLRNVAHCTLGIALLVI
jgi:hypothetical protein